MYIYIYIQIIYIYISYIYISYIYIYTHHKFDINQKTHTHHNIYIYMYLLDGQVKSHKTTIFGCFDQLHNPSVPTPSPLALPASLEDGFPAQKGRSPNRRMELHVFAYGPKTGLVFLRFVGVVICWGGGVKRGNSVLIGSARASSQAASTSFPLSANSQSVQHLELIASYTSISLSSLDSAYKLCSVLMLCPDKVKTLHVTLHTSFVLRLTLHLTLHTSFVLRWTHFMLRCTRLLFFGELLSWSWHMPRLGNGGAIIGMQMSATSLPGLSASWCEEKRSAGAVTKNKTIQKT